MKKSLFILYFICFAFFSCTSPSSDNIAGLWKSRDLHSPEPRALVVIYEYKGKYYGRMLATYDDQGSIKDSIVNPNEKATGVVGSPPYCGLDFIYNLQKEKNSKSNHAVYAGKILNPQTGKIYSVEIWRDKNDLVVRPELLVFGKDIVWPKASKRDLPEGFSLNSVRNFKPLIPQAS